MRVHDVRGFPVPDGMVIEVVGWHWPPAMEEASVKVFRTLYEQCKTDVPDTGVGVWRGREETPDTHEKLDWFVFVVTVNFDVFERVPMMKTLEHRRRDPDMEHATRLVIRHVEKMVRDAGKKGHRTEKAHYGLGALLDEFGQVHIRTGQG